MWALHGRGRRRATRLKGARPVPGPIMMMGSAGSAGSLKSGFLCTYTGTVSPTCSTVSGMRRHTVQPTCLS